MVEKRRILLEDLFKAYYSCRKNKRNTLNALAFELNLEEELIQLKEEIESGRYAISSSIAFVVDKPVKREIFAANFRDRVVHHFLIQKIYQLLLRLHQYLICHQFYSLLLQGWYVLLY